MMLMATMVASIYSVNSSSSKNFISVGGVVSAFFGSMNSASYSLFHVNSFGFLNNLKSGFAFSMIMGRNLDREVILPASCCTLDTLLGLLISKIDLHLSRFTFFLGW